MGQVQIKLLLLSFLVLGCYGKPNDVLVEKDNIPRYEDLLCRKNNMINRLLKNKKKYECYQLMLIDELCENDLIEKNYLARIFRNGSAVIISYRRIGDCIVKDKKIIPENTFGISSYLQVGNDISYEVERQPNTKYEEDKLDNLFGVFTTQSVFPHAESIYKLEIIRDAVETRYSSEEILNKKDFTFLEEIGFN